MALIEQRHPALGGLIALWRARASGDCPPAASAMTPASLAEHASLTVTLMPDAGTHTLVVAESGDAVDALYGAALKGGPAAQLSPARGDDAEREARAAIESRRPLLIEDALCGADRRRIARLYLPLSNDDGSPDGVLCGVVAVA